MVDDSNTNNPSSSLGNHVDNFTNNKISKCTDNQKDVYPFVNDALKNITLAQKIQVNLVQTFLVITFDNFVKT
jgi:hypothetical protein